MLFSDLNRVPGYQVRHVPSDEPLQVWQLLQRRRDVIHDVSAADEVIDGVQPGGDGGRGPERTAQPGTQHTTGDTHRGLPWRPERTAQPGTQHTTGDTH